MERQATEQKPLGQTFRNQQSVAVDDRSAERIIDEVEMGFEHRAMRKLLAELSGLAVNATIDEYKAALLQNKSEAKKGVGSMVAEAIFYSPLCY